jgi:hypothetical protein
MMVMYWPSMIVYRLDSRDSSASSPSHISNKHQSILEGCIFGCILPILFVISWINNDLWRDMNPSLAIYLSNFLNLKIIYRKQALYVSSLSSL